jgi:hypothetical protein
MAFDDGLNRLNECVNVKHAFQRKRLWPMERICLAQIAEGASGAE